VSILSITARRIGGVVAVLPSLPTCDLCEAAGEPIPNPGRFDAKSVQGPWGYFCFDHWAEYGYGRLGLGVGQYLVTEAEVAAGDALPDEIAPFVEAAEVSA
jgi:hypothetical protein